MVERLKAFSPALIWSAIILGLSISPSISLPPSWMDLIGWDKVGHLTFYAILAMTWAWGFQKWGRPNLRRSIWISIFYGILIECVQYTFFPNRYFEVLDIIANIIGVLLGALIFVRINS